MIKKISQLVQQENYLAVVVFFIAFVVYHGTMCPTVSFTDSGELATVATTLGIAHPTGYPLWTLIGRLAVMMPLGGEEIVRLNVFACVLTALAVAFFFKLVLSIYHAPMVFRLKNESVRGGDRWIPLFGAFITALTVGFSSTIWAQSVEIEVYALHVLFVILSSMFFISGIEEQLVDPERISKRLLLFSFLLGLSFTNHMTTILLAPGFLYLYFVSLGSNRRSWRLIVALVPFFVLGLTAYLYLPIRSSSGTLLDWGHPVTFERFWWHVTGKQYQTWMFSGWNVLTKQLNYFLTNFSTEFHWPAVALIVVGLIETFNQSKRLLMFLALLFGTCLMYAVNFDIHEIDPYFLLAYLACGCCLGIAVKRVVEWSSNKKSTYFLLVTLVILVSLPAIQIVGNRGDVDQSHNSQAADFVQNVFDQLEPNAVVFSSLWDYFVSPSYYYQVVRRERPDVILIDAELLQNRSWYFIQLVHNHPEIFDSSHASVRAFLDELTKFERGEPFDFTTIKARWDGLLVDLVSNLLEKHPVYVDGRIAGQFSNNFDAVPEGLLVRLTHKGKPGVWKPIAALPAQGTFSNYVTSDLRRYVASMYTFHSYWMLTQKRLPEALDNLQNALHIDPGFLPALDIKARLSSRPR
jgi:hypothetical protein